MSRRAPKEVREVWVAERPNGEPYSIYLNRNAADRVVAGRRDRIELRVRRYVPDIPDEETPK